MTKPFYYLWFSISSGKLSLSLFTMAITMIIYSITNSASFAAIVMLLNVVGKLLSSIIFPLLSEKIPLNKILRNSQFIQLFNLLIILMVLNMVTNQVFEIIALYILIVLTGFIDGFISPARISLIPELVEDHKIGKANSLIGTTDQSFALLGWSVGAIIMQSFGGNVVLIISLVLLTLALLSSLKVKSKKIIATEKKPKWEIIESGWTILFSKKDHMRTITIMDILEGIGSSIWIGGITLVFVNEVLQKGEQWWGFINTSYYAGSILGGLLITIFSVRIQRNLLKYIVIGSFGVSVLVLLYAFNRIGWLALVLVILMGPFYQLRDISQQTYIQKVGERSVLSKIYAAKDNLYYLIFAVSVFISGLVSDYIGVVYVYYLAFFLYLISTIIAIYTLRVKKEKNNISQKLI